MKQEQQRSPSAVLTADWEWADNIDATALRRMAQVTRELFKQPERWIHRRVERVYFKDHQLVHHQVSVDFTLPAGVPPIGKFEGKDVYIAPLFLLVKDSPKPLREGRQARRRFLVFGERRPNFTKRTIPTAPCSNLDFINQDGQRLPLLTRNQSSLLATTVLLEAAERVVGKPITGKLREQISAVPHRSWIDLGEVLKWLLGEEPESWYDPRVKLRGDKTFTELVYTLASHSIIACLLLDGPPRRSVYKLSYDEPANVSVSMPKGAVMRSLGWKSEQYFVSLNEIGASASYHVEIEVPKELLINAVSLVGKRYRWFDDLLNKDNCDYSIQQIGSTSEGKIYIPQPLAGRRVGLTWVKLRARRSGFLFGALFASIVIAFMLTIAAFAVPIVVQENQSESATAALLLVPALLAVYVARPGEHAITAKMLRWVRAVLVMDAILPVLAVLVLITTHDEKNPHHVVASLKLGPIRLGEPSLIWIVFAAISIVFAMLISISNILPRPHGETVYQPAPNRTSRVAIPSDPRGDH